MIINWLHSLKFYWCYLWGCLLKLDFEYVFIEKTFIMKPSFSDLNIKERLAIISACAAFTLGWILTGIAAFVPLLLSEQAILWILGQGMTYAAAVFGVSMYFNAEARQMKHDINKHIEHMDRMMIERERLMKGMDMGEIPEEKDEDE